MLFLASLYDGENFLGEPRRRLVEGTLTFQTFKVVAKLLEFEIV